MERTRVLFVDDNAVLRSVLTHVLEQDGHTVVQAGTLVDARGLIAATTEDFDLVITDVMAGAVPTGDLIRAIRELRPKTPVLVISGLAKEEAELRLANRCDDFLQKPFTAEDMLERVRSMINCGPGQSRVSEAEPRR